MKAALLLPELRHLAADGAGVRGTHRRQLQAAGTGTRPGRLASQERQTDSAALRSNTIKGSMTMTSASASRCFGLNVNWVGISQQWKFRPLRGEG